MSQRNWICLAVDRLQAGLLGPYGNTWIRTPNIDRLAAQSLVFDQCHACHPQLNAVLDALWPTSWPSVVRSRLLTDDPLVAAHPRAQNLPELVLHEQRAEVTRAAQEVAATQMAAFFSRAAEEVEAAREPVNLWLHSRGLAGPWDAPLEMRNQFAEEEDPQPPSFTAPPEMLLSSDYDPDKLLGITQACAAQILIFDTCLGLLLDALDASPLADETLFVLVGLRGFPLGEHLRVGVCDAALYNELTHVPLLVRSPDRSGAMARSPWLVTHQDLATLHSNWLEGEGSATNPLTSLLSAVGPAEIAWRDHLVFQSQSDRAIRTPAWYLREQILSPGAVNRELYVKPDDRWEVNDVADRCPEIVTQLAGILSSPPRTDPQRLPEELTAELE